MSFCLRYISLFVLLMGTVSAWSQKAERDYIRKGNRFYRDSVYVDAEINYRKALDANSQSTTSMYNLGNSLLFQNKIKEALEQYVNASKIETDKPDLAQIYHNMGVIFQSQKDYARAIEAYKESLRNNPKDDETRYNLVLAQKMLKDQQQQQNQQQQQQKNEQQKQNQKQEQEQQNQQQQQNHQQQNQMSRESADQLLNSVMQDEKKVQNKVKKQQQIQGSRLEKDW